MRQDTESGWRDQDGRELGPLAEPALRALLSAAAVGFAVLDAQLRYAAINTRLAEINGLPAAAHVGRHVREVVPQLPEGAENAFRAVLQTGEPVRELELSAEVASSPGVRRHWLASAYPVPGPDGTPAAVAVLAWEVTARVEAEQSRAQMLALLDLLVLRAPIGIAFLDRDLRYLRINDTLARANGSSVADHLGRTVEQVLPEASAQIAPLLRKVLETGEPIIDLELETSPTPAEPGRDRHWRLSYYPVPAGDGGPPQGVGAIVTDETDRYEARRERDRLQAAEREAVGRADEAAARQGLLQRLTAALAEQVTVADVARVTISVISEALGADATALSRRDGTDLVLLARRGMPDAQDEQWSRFRINETAISREVFRWRRPVLVSSTAERDRRFPEMAGLRVRQQSWANLPLLVKGNAVGMVSFGWRAPRTFDPDEVGFLEALAAQCAVALDRAYLYETERASRHAAERARQQLDLLSCASEALHQHLNEDAVLDRLGSLLLDGGAGWVAILVEDSMGRPTVRCCRGRSGQASRFAASAAHSTTWPALDPEQQPPSLGALAERLDVPIGPRCAKWPLTVTVVPTATRDRVLLLTARDVGDASAILDEPTLVELARRAAVAYDNARLYAAQARVARRLQDNLLPKALPSVPGVELAARYATAERSVDVGGDFYDVFPVDRGRWALVIGDVTGRGIEAAGTTALARHSLRALESHCPAEALARLNHLLRSDSSDTRLMTVAYVLAEPGADGQIRVTVARAGHPPPLLVRSDGATVTIEPPGVLVGATLELGLTEVTEVLRPGDSLILYTDGVTEAHGADGLFGEERLSAVAAATAGTPADLTAAAVFDAVVRYRAGDADDDMAILVLHVSGREPSPRP